MGYSLKKKLNVGILLVSLLLAFMLMGGKVGAEGASFSYEAKTGDNLTKLVRRSIELYSVANEVDLNMGQAIAAETAVVQELGAYELNVGQKVDVAEASVETAVTDAAGLTETAASRWAAYGPITRGLASVQPVAAPEYVASEELAQPEEESSDTTANGDSDTTAASAQTENENNTDDADENEDSAPWYWWVIGGAAIGVMWYVLGGNEIVKNRRK